MRKLCGFRPTGRLHLGHYFSVIKPALEDTSVEILIADYHAPDTHYHLRNNESLLELLESFGIHDSRCLIQSQIFNGPVFFQMLELAKTGDLKRMTQFKSCPEEDRTAQLLTYPVLMAHDVAGYDEVIVGEDQQQHLEYCRKLIKKHNKVYEQDYRIPKATVIGGRVMDLVNPDKKMSKSSPTGCLFLDDTEEDIMTKLMRAKTDEAGLRNLHYLFDEFVDEEPPTSNAQMKCQLAAGIHFKLNFLRKRKSHESS